MVEKNDGETPEKCRVISTMKQRCQTDFKRRTPPIHKNPLSVWGAVHCGVFYIDDLPSRLLN